MPIPLNQSPDVESAQGDYLDLNPEGSRVSVHVHLDAVDGIVRDVVEDLKTEPREGLEIGGLLLGKVESGDHPSVRIDRYQRIPCAHHFGPQFVLDQEDQSMLERAAGDIISSGNLSVVGLYRSHARPGLRLDQADLDLMGRYFSDPSDLMLLIKPETADDISARFFRRDAAGNPEPVGPPFPFRGRALSLDTINGAEDENQTRQTIVTPERPRRLVPDFVPSAVEPSHTFRPEPPMLADASPTHKRARNWWPLLAAILLVGAGAWLLLQPGRRLSSNSAPSATKPDVDRPLGLYVDPAGDTWRVSWNPNATALHDARSVQLFVREGDDQNRVDLMPADLASGIYQYRPASHGNDVTFRLEVAENSGRVSAESFRLTSPAAPTPAPVAATPKPSPAPAATAHNTEPRATRRVPPVVPVSIRPRIKASIPIDVRVHIDANGRVISAATVVKQPSGLHAYLADRAVEAARQWRFEPARQNGKPIPGSETIHFVFDK